MISENIPMAEALKILQQDGLPGLDRILHHPDSLSVKLVARVLSMTIIPKVLSYFTEFDSSIGEKGLGQAAREFLSRLRINVLVNNPPIPDCFSHTGVPVLFFSNHLGQLEPYVTTSLVGRDDCYYIGGTEGLRMGENVARHVLSVKARKSALSRHHGEGSSIYRIVYGAPMTEEEIKEMNDTSYSNAAEKLEKGSMVGIFPTGARRSINDNWYNGIGRIVAEIPQEMRDRILIVPIHIGGLQKKDFKRLFLELLFLGRPLKIGSVAVNFGQVVPLSQVVGADSSKPEEITQQIRKYYREQFKALLEPSVEPHPTP